MAKSLNYIITEGLTAWKVSVFGVILVPIFPHSDWIWRDTIQSECGKIRNRITLNTETFYAVTSLSVKEFVIAKGEGKPTDTIKVACRVSVAYLNHHFFTVF